jgi:DNA-binding MarR family transcriptional regulator
MKQKQLPFGYSAIEDNTGFLLWQVSHMWQIEQERALKERFGISQLQYVILASTYWLNLNKVEVSQSYLSRHTKIEKMTMSKNIRELQKKSYLSRKTHSKDLRANSVFITEEGKELMAKAIAVVERIDNEFMISLKKNIRSFNSSLLSLIKYNSNSFFYNIKDLM